MSASRTRHSSHDARCAADSRQRRSNWRRHQRHRRPRKPERPRAPATTWGLVEALLAPKCGGGVLRYAPQTRRDSAWSPIRFAECQRCRPSPRKTTHLIVAPFEGVVRTALTQGQRAWRGFVRALSVHDGPDVTAVVPRTLSNVSSSLRAWRGYAKEAHRGAGRGMSPGIRPPSRSTAQGGGDRNLEAVPR